MRGTKKQDLPEKVCATCQKPFSWRKKWEKDWDEVKYCSERCRRNRMKKDENSNLEY
ncbi:MAG: hypothetical protein ACI8QD_001342 [Cyclobacteriaceae bacterium]|jgi:hypothetical protein